MLIVIAYQSISYVRNIVLYQEFLLNIKLVPTGLQQAFHSPCCRMTSDFEKSPILVSIMFTSRQQYQFNYDRSGSMDYTELLSIAIKFSETYLIRVRGQLWGRDDCMVLVTCFAWIKNLYGVPKPYKSCFWEKDDIQKNI